MRQHHSALGAAVLPVVGQRRAQAAQAKVVAAGRGAGPHAHIQTNCAAELIPQLFQAVEPAGRGHSGAISGASWANGLFLLGRLDDRFAPLFSPAGGDLVAIVTGGWDGHEHCGESKI